MRYILLCGLVWGVIVYPCWAETIVVNPDGSGDFTNIQDAINYSWDGDTVVVYPGTYNQSIHFNGRRIILTSLNPDDGNIVKSMIIQNQNNADNPPVTFDFGEDSDSVITGFTIISYMQYNYSQPAIKCSLATPTILKNRISSSYGIGIKHCEGVISNNIISNCVTGILSYKGVISNNVIVNTRDVAGCSGCSSGIEVERIDYLKQTVIIKNNIITNNLCGLLVRYYSSGYVICNNSFNCLWNNSYNYGDIATAGTGDFCRDPLFADADYHLKSTAGRWVGTGWVIDDVDSPCIDRGDPSDPIGVEPNPNGNRINMGAYGGTSQASKSSSGINQPICINPPSTDTNNDCKIDLIDFVEFAGQWMTCGYDIQAACWE